MKTLCIAAFLVAAPLLVAGCSPDTSPQEPSSSAAKEEKGVIPEYQLKALEDAKKTDELIKKAEEQRMKQLE